MAQSKREEYERKREHIRELAEEGELVEQDADAILEWCDAYDDEKATATPNGGEKTVGDKRWGSSRAPTTLYQWAVCVSAYARDVDGSVLDATAPELNESAQRMYDGRTPVVRSSLSKNSVRTRQHSLKKFLQHADATADPDELHIFDSESTLVDPADMLTQEEFHAFRNAPEHPRDRVITNLFLYTGQRNHAIRTLRIKDIDLEEGRYRLNTTVDGLKGADLVATWNPLLGAVNALRDWLNHHPAPDDGDAYLLTERRDHRERDPYSTISDDTVNRVLRETAEAIADEYPAIEQKPTNAHAMRHNFVTMCKVVYDMDNDTIKRLIRHKPDSTVMETTYAHLSDEDYIKKAEEAFGLRDEEEEEFSASPETCDVCSEPLPPNAKACANCGTVYTPDAMDAQKSLQEQAESRIPEVRDEQEARVVRAVLEDLRENPIDFIEDEQ